MSVSRPQLLQGKRSTRLMSVMGALLCAASVAPDAVGAAPVRHGLVHAGSAAQANTPLTRQQRTLHALERLTFGPRPGEAAAVDRMGLDTWFQQQLHPETVPDTALDLRLAEYPAMQLSQVQLMQQFPTPAMLRRYSAGTLPAPDDPETRAVYADAGLLAQQKRERRKETKPADADSMSAAAPPHDVAGPASIPARPEAAAPAEAQQGQAIAWPPVGAGEGTEIVPTVDVAAVLALSPTARMQRLVTMSPQEMVGFRKELRPAEQQRLLLGLTPQQRETVEAMRSPERMVDREDAAVRLLRDVYSQRQLQAVMADFWLNHFSTYLHKNQNEPYLLPAYEREAILPNALGHFEDLLVATAQSPAMLVYLDNAESVGPNSTAGRRALGKEAPRTAGKAKTPRGINENYARELMELHTLGVQGGYTQQDVVEVAKCFTGWTLDRPAEGGTFVFNPNRHEPGPKTVLGHVIPEGGMQEGLEVLHILATSPATAHFVSLKLAERFVSDSPPPTLVNRMAATFLKTDGDLRAVLTTLYRSPEFWAPATVHAKVKTPLEFLVSALRATDAEVREPIGAVQALDRLGMPLYGMQTPNGYSWQADAWVSSNALLTRMNFALVFSGNRLPGTHLDWATLLQPAAQGPATLNEATEARLEQVLLGRPASSQTRSTALAQAEVPDVQQQAEQAFRALPMTTRTEGAAERDGAKPRSVVDGGGSAHSAAGASSLATAGGLLLGSPEFQRR